MDETELAIFVFNPQDENPFEGLGQWDGDLEKAATRPFKKLLVAGRCDRGGLMVTKRSIQEFRKKHGFAKYIETSAQTGAGCDELREAISKSIDWKSIPWTASSAIFKTLKEEIVKLRDEGLVLLRMTELEQQMSLRLPDESFTMEELRAVVGLLAGPGLLWKLEFGDFVLLQPERVNAYAAAVVRKVRKHTDEIGSILERDIVDANLDFQDMKRLPPDEEAIILRAMHQSFVDRGICLREDTDEGTQLVLPSYFKRERPELEGQPAEFVSYEFSGNSDAIYATLVVRLHHTSVFENDTLWKFAADFKTHAGMRLGIKLTKKREGTAELLVYCDPKVSDDSKVTFVKYVHEHLLRKGIDVARYRHYVCANCGHPVRDSELAREILEEKGKRASIGCQRCRKMVPLWDLLEEKFASEEFQRIVRELEEESRAGIDREKSEIILVAHAYAIASEAGELFVPYPAPERGIDAEIRFTDASGEPTSERVYLQLRTDAMYERTQDPDGSETFRIRKPKLAEHWREQEVPVMLVHRTEQGDIRWMDVRGVKRRFRFNGKAFTAISLSRLRARVTG